MNIHKNAGTTPNMRALIVERRRAGETPRAMAGAGGVSPRPSGNGSGATKANVWRVSRTGPAGRTACGRGSHPSRSLGRNPAPEPSTVLENRPSGKSPARPGFPRDRGPHRQGQGAEPTVRPRSKIEIIRYEKNLPGEMIHSDIKKRGRIEGIGHRITGKRTGQSAPRSRKQGGKGGKYFHLAVDDHSRLASSEIS